jgi:tetratricopeptide (TPR) repeat protein
VKSKPKKGTFIPDELYFCTILNSLTMNRRPGKHKNNINELVARYERMLNGDAQSFFDTHEFEDIADHYIDRGLLGEAMSSMEIAFEQYPFSASFLIKKAQILTILERLEEATLSLEIAESLEPSNSDLHIAKGSILSKKRAHQKALKHFEKAQTYSDDPIEVYPFIAFEYQCLGKFHDAIKYLSDFLNEEPEDEIALFNIAYCYERLDAYNDAILFFKSLIEMSPYCEVTWYQLGLFYNKIKGHKEAVWALDYAILIDECFTAAYHEKARSLTQMAETKEAIKTYLLTFAFEDATGFTFLKIGLCYKQLSLYKQAIRYFTKACHEDPQLSEAWMEIGLCYDAKGASEEGLHYINKALNLNPDDLEYIYIQTKIYRKIGIFDEAVLGYQKLIDLNCDSPTLWMEFAFLKKEMNESKDAIRLLKSGVKIHKNNVDLLFRLGAYLFLDGQIEKASIYLQKANALDSKSSTVLYEHLPVLEGNATFKQLLK